MLRKMISIALMLACGPLLDGVNGQQAEKGAKAIFLDTQTGRMIMPMQSRPAPAGAASSPQAGSVQVPAITGLMYYVELLQPSGELMRVSSTRVFHSGEKVRLHVTANVDGMLVILQRQGSGIFERLFPLASMPEAAAFVRKGLDTVLPSASGWFRFDERPGDIHLLMMLTAGPEPVPNTMLASRSGMADQPRGTAASMDDRAEMMLAFDKVQRGSKGLMIETNSSPKEGYEVRVVNTAKDNTLLPGQIVIELKLQHRPRG